MITQDFTELFKTYFFQARHMMIWAALEASVVSFDFDSDRLTIETDSEFYFYVLSSQASDILFTIAGDSLGVYVRFTEVDFSPTSLVKGRQ